MIEKSTTTEKLLDENKKLIDWIRKILETFGTAEVREHHVNIPVIKNRYEYGQFNDIFCETERIEIPSITILKSTMRQKREEG